MILRAPAKLNLCLYLGPRSSDGLHELTSLFCPLSLADRIVVSDADADEDQVVCAGVEAPDLSERALRALRERGWERGPVRIEVEKRIPIAAGLGGGSADAGAVLRLAADEINGLDTLAAGLGSDVPSQIEPRMSLVGGVGERVEPLPDPGEFAAVLVPGGTGLDTGDVYAEADRLGLGRDQDELTRIEAQLRDAASGGAGPLEYAPLLVNDLEPAALSLRPEIAAVLVALRDAGAAVAIVAGSGPTAAGLFETLPAADRAAAAMPPRFADSIVTGPDSFRRLS